MRILVCTLAAAALLVGLSPAASAVAQEPLASIANFPSRTNTPLTTPTEDEDHKVLGAALKSLATRAPNALAPHLPALRASFDRMPADYGLTAVAGDAILVRNNNDVTTAVAGLLAARATEDGQKASSIHAMTNVYGYIGQLLGFYAVEHRDFDGAIAIFDRILAAQPHNPIARAERIVAITLKGDCERAIKEADEAIADENIYMALSRPLFLRRKGYCQIETGALEAAKASYEKALEIDPEDQLSISQLTYIRQQMAAR